MNIVKDSDGVILKALAFGNTLFSKTDIRNVAKAVGHPMGSSTKFLQEYMDKQGCIFSPQNVSGVPHYCLRYGDWKELLTSVTSEEYSEYGRMVLGFGEEKPRIFARAFWLYIHQKDVPANFWATLNNIMSWSREVLLEDYLENMVYDKDLLPFVAMTRNYLQEVVFSKISMDLNLQEFTPDNIEAILALLDIIVDEKSQGYVRQLRKKAMLSYSFMRQMDIPAIVNGTKSTDDVYGCFYESFMLLQQEKYDDAVKLMLKYLKSVQKKAFCQSIFDFYYAVALTHSTLPAAEKRRGMLLKNLDNLGLPGAARLLLLLENDNGKTKGVTFLSYWRCAYNEMDRALLLVLADRYDLDVPFKPQLEEEVFKFIDDRGIGLLQLELSSCYDRYKAAADEICSRVPGLHTTLPAIEKLELWDSVLNDVLQMHNSPAAKSKKGTAKKESQTRIVYELNTNNLNIQPRLQKSKDGVTWTAGRNVSVEKFGKGTAEGMTDVDRIIAAYVQNYSYGWYGQVGYELSGGKAVAALVGNPNVYDASTSQHLEVVEEKPSITVTKSGGNYKVTTDVDVNKLDHGIFVRKESAQKVKVVMVSTKLKKTLELLKDIQFPEQAKDKLTKVLELVSNDMIVMSDLLKSSENIANKHTHPETVVQLQPQGDSIYCHTFVRPFGSVPPVCKPGKGMQVITTTMDGKQVQTKRNTKKESENFEAVKTLLVDCESIDDYSWTLAPVECLTLLEQLQAMQGQCTVEWPEGGQLNVVRPQLQPADFNISVGNIAGWFEISGDIQIDDKKKLKIAELVDSFSRSKGDFVSLGDNDYVRITSQLRKYIDRLSRVTSTSKGKLRLSPFNVFMLEELGNSGVQLNADEAYTSLIKRIEEAGNADIKIPRTINADLRDYQKEGYRWMSRLAAWGAGALLADDMGLGKTLQTITLLLSRAAQGPQLVIVPTSLVMNWREEIARFAPSLNVSLLNTYGDAREQMVSGAKEYDIVIATYGLLVTEEELLTGREWITVVLDEAHTIKNRETKMSKAAMKLQSQFRVLLTGTPLQNHLSEIWNLMQFANPSLLGTYQEFQDRFIVPVERDHDKDRQQLLRRIISPFLLRRTKSEVLNELPEKTEVTIKVDLSADEWAFYDNIRQQALAAMENSENNAMQALAEITRLRQAACDVRLVEKGLNLPSSKQEAFMQLVSDLHDNHHRALVFSQFTSHLALIRQRLDEEGIEYLYLDGSTTAKERIALVDKFQHGDMPIFLISLKAGGLGLNLTAADYIVHLDPWWNPAIEDQASDRAYRMGQQNPVTIYRIIAAGTIEEKIISLHQTKKNLADALLEGSDVSAAMTRDEMLALLRETM